VFWYHTLWRLRSIYLRDLILYLCGKEARRRLETEPTKLRIINSSTMRTVLQESYADRVRRERKGEGMETVNQLPQIEWTSETPTYDAVSPSKSEAWDELDISNGNIARRFRLSRSPLDSLQMEFKRYGKPDARAKDSLVCIVSSHPYSRPHRMFEPIRDLALAVYLRKALGCVMHYRGLRDLRLTPSRIFYRPIVSRAHKSSKTLTN